MNPTQDDVENKIYPHVLSNVNELVSALCNDERYMDELADIMSQPDYQNPAYDAGYEVEERHGIYYLYKYEISVNSICDFETEREAWEYACNEIDIEPYTNDALEHYIVTDWLANELESRGEMINRDFLGLTIWGRACSGQGILLDAVMVEITKDAMERTQ